MSGYNYSNTPICHTHQASTLPLMTGLYITIPSRFGSDTVLSRISPPMLWWKRKEKSVCMGHKQNVFYKDTTAKYTLVNNLNTLHVYIFIYNLSSNIYLTNLSIILTQQMWMTYLLMTKAVIIGSQPEYSSFLLSGCRKDITTHTGIRHSKNVHSRYVT